MFRPLFVGLCVWSLVCYALLSVVSSFAVILTRMRELKAKYQFSPWCHVTVSVMWLFLRVQWAGMQCVIWYFLIIIIYLLYVRSISRWSHCCN